MEIKVEITDKDLEEMISRSKNLDNIAVDLILSNKELNKYKYSIKENIACYIGGIL